MTERHIFISYSPTDQPYVQQVAEQLQQQGFAVWLNDGKRRWPTIQKAIRDCGAVVLIISEEANTAKSVQREVELAESLRLPILPILRSGSPDVLLQREIAHFDALNGGLPDADFYDRLAEHVARSDDPVSVPTQLSGASDNADDALVDLEDTAVDETAEQPPTPFLASAALKMPAEPVMRNTDWQPVSRVINGIEMVLVPPGCFLMGSDDDEQARPVQSRCLERAFWIGRYPVTTGQYLEAVRQHVCEISRWSGDFRFNDPHQPVIGIGWSDALKFAQWKQMRLPTETEWEFAARGPAGWTWPWGDDFAAENVTYAANANGRTGKIGGRPTSASWVGAFDLSGNVWEWCLSVWRADYTAAEDNRTKPAEANRVLRGGSFLDAADQNRAATRSSDDPIFGNVNIGFRVVCTAPVVWKYQ